MTEDALATLAEKLAANVKALRKGRARYAQTDALHAVLDFLRSAGIPDESLLPLHEIFSELAHAQDREEHPDKRPSKPIKTTVDQAHALAVVDFLMEDGAKLEHAARKVASKVPGLGLSWQQLVNLRKDAGRGKERREMQEQRYKIVQLARDNGLPPKVAAESMLGILRERCYKKKRGVTRP